MQKSELKVCVRCTTHNAPLGQAEPRRARLGWAGELTLFLKNGHPLSYAAQALVA
jgi:hypothetical protein